MITYRQITIEWSYPVEINSILQKECMKDIGIYYISRNFDNNLKISNIGYRGQLPKVLYIPEEWLEEYDENTGSNRYKKKNT